MSAPDQLTEPEPAEGRTTRWDRQATVVVAAVVGALAQGYADAVWRISEDVPWGSHWLGVTGLYLAVGALVGLVALAITRAETRLTRWLSTRFFAGQRRLLLGSILYGLVAVLASYGTAFWTFSGAGIHKTLWGVVGPPVFLFVVFLCVLELARQAKRAMGRAGQGRRGSARWLAAFCVLLTVLFTYVDQTVYLHLYDRLHSYLEGLALVALVLASSLLLEPISSRPWRRSVKRYAALGACLWLVSAVAFQSLRESVDSRLTHAWLEPVHAGRMLKRAGELEAWLRDPLGGNDVAMLQLERLRNRYDLEDTTLAASWREPGRLAPSVEEVPERPQDYNVVIFYVDTLRYDVSHDPQIMPNVAQFANESLNFRRAYATGSDTLRSLPGLTGGNYFVRNTHRDDLCEIAKRSQHKSALFIAKSAREFLKQLRPSFGLEEEFEVPDYEKGREVWGYGAHQPSAPGIVDGALDYLAKHRGEKSFLWLFHFDQHNWREIDDDYVDVVRAKYRVPQDGVLNSRYRAVASAIDGEFSRFRDGLQQLGLTDKTVLLFVSDHGEGLGDGGFWVHSVFLWETLIHVPLILSVPGTPPKNVESVVSLVDVAPTLASFLTPHPNLSGYHGEDLLRRSEPAAPARNFPVLFAAALRDQLVRVGMVTKSGDSKLVVRLEAALPELHDLNVAKPDDRSVASARPELTRALLREVARSPIFPRSQADFPMLEPKGNIEFASPSSSLTLRAP